MTTAPATARPTGASRAGRTGSVAWMAFPALLIFSAFGLIPLLGVIGAELHHLGRDRCDPSVRLDNLVISAA